MSSTDAFIRKSVTDIVQCTHGGRIAEYSRKSGEDFLDFSANLNPLGPPNMDLIRKATSMELENMDRYPDNRYLELRASAAGFAGVGPENIIPTNGSSELIRLIAETILDAGDTVIVPQPTFDEYELNVKLMSAVAKHVEYREVYKDPEILTGALLTGAKAVFICNPNNPTGTLISRSQLDGLADRCRDEGTFLVVDEAFINLSDPDQSMADRVRDNPFIIVLRSLTKEFAIPGMRVGYGIAHTDVASRMDSIRIPWNVGAIPAAVGTLLMDIHSKDPSFLERSRHLINSERQWLIENLSRIRGFQPVESTANFIFIKIRDFGMDSGELTSRMHNQGILIRNCESFRQIGRDYIRVAVRNRDENRKLINALAESVNQWGRELAEQKIDEAVHQGKIFSRTNCEYYPCHFEGQDCTFCFCPFYPCLDTRTGGQMVERSTGGQVWSCSECYLIHRPEIANKVLEALMESQGKPEDIRRIWKKVMDPLL